jgi:histone deacetylase 11
MCKNHSKFFALFLFALFLPIDSSPAKIFKEWSKKKKKITAIIGGTAVVGTGLGIYSFFKKDTAKKTGQLPLVYHPEYNISLLGLENLHSFDSKKYKTVYNYLLQNRSLTKDSFWQPRQVTNEELLQVHTKKYLDSLKNSSTIEQIAEIGVLKFVPNFLLQRKFLDPMKFATWGTVLGAQLALKHGWAINLSGGYHHAKSNQGGGFCYFADISLAIYEIHKTWPEAKILIIDLDAHQGNGHESIHANDERVKIFDVYSEYNYPKDEAAKKAIDFNYPVKHGIRDAEYLQILNSKLPKAIDESNPDLIIYNAGTDIFEKDSLGRMNVSEAGIIKRDELVFRLAKDKRIPILTVLSGGYSPDSAGIIGRSLENILKNVLSVVK